MSTQAKGIVLILLVSAFCGFSQSSPTPRVDSTPSVSEIALGFTNYQRITKSVVHVNPELARLCRGATKKEVESARSKFGPHGHTGILIYMNDLAAETFRTNASSFPVGAVVVKQKTMHGYFGDDGKWVRDPDTGVGGMVKRSHGYDAEHGDWEYFYFEDSKKIESGRISSCVKCHEAAKSKDYIFGSWSKTGDQQ